MQASHPQSRREDARKPKPEHRRRRKCVLLLCANHAVGHPIARHSQETIRCAIRLVNLHIVDAKVQTVLKILALWLLWTIRVRTLRSLRSVERIAQVEQGSRTLRVLGGSAQWLNGLIVGTRRELHWFRELYQDGVFGAVAVTPAVIP